MGAPKFQNPLLTLDNVHCQTQHVRFICYQTKIQIHSGRPTNISLMVITHIHTKHTQVHNVLYCII